VTVAELFAEGAASREEMGAAYEAAAGRAEGAAAFAALGTAKVWAAFVPDVGGLADLARMVAENAAEAVADAGVSPCPAARSREFAAQTRLLHCLFGGAAGRTPLDRSLLAWNGGVIPRLAQAAYDDRRLPECTLDAARLAVLADALEEAGAAAGLGGHLREPGGVHVRGCHVLDLVLQKE
jgi:hypothetical protein